MAQPENPDREPSWHAPYGYGDERHRISERLVAIEQRVALQTREVDALRADHAKLAGDFGKHLDHAVDEARRAAERQDVVLSVVTDLRADVRVLKEQRGHVSISTVAQVAGILGMLAGAVFSLVKMAGG